MKAKIKNLWDTPIEIIDSDSDSDTNEIHSISDLRKCENVLIEKTNNEYIVMIENCIVSVYFRNINHPSGCGKLRICEILYYC